MLNFDFKKRNMKEEKDIGPMENDKVIEMKDIVILVKLDEMCSILKSMLASV